MHENRCVAMVKYAKWPNPDKLVAVKMNHMTVFAITVISVISFHYSILPSKFVVMET